MEPSTEPSDTLHSRATESDKPYPIAKDYPAGQMQLELFLRFTDKTKTIASDCEKTGTVDNVKG